MGVKLQLVLGLVLISLVWIASSSSVEISDTKPQEHPNDDRKTNTIAKQPKTETEIKYVYKNTPTDNKQQSPTKNLEISSSSERNDDIHEKQNEVEKDGKIENGNAIKKEAAPKRREDNIRSIDIEKYTSPEFQNNEFTLPVSSDTEKYLEEPFSFKTSTRKGQDFDHTTSKTSIFSKFTDPIQKLEQEYEQRFKEPEHHHHRELEEDDHMEEMENEHDDEHDHENEEHDMEDHMTVDKMIERSESVPTNISMGWEMKVSKNNDDEDDDAKNKNFKGFTMVKYRKVDYVSQYNDTKVLYPLDPKGTNATTTMVNITGTSTTTTTTSTTSTTTTSTTPRPTVLSTRKYNMFTKPPAEKNNSDLLNNKIESETIKAIITTELPSTKRSKAVEAVLSNEQQQVVQENQASSFRIATSTPVPKQRLFESTTTEKRTTTETPTTKLDNMEPLAKDQIVFTPKINAKIVEIFPSGDSSIQFTTTESTTTEEPHVSTTISQEQDVFVGTDITTNDDYESTTEFETETTKTPNTGISEVQNTEPFVTTIPTTTYETPEESEPDITQPLPTRTIDTSTITNDIKQETEPFETTSENPMEIVTQYATVPFNGVMSDATTIFAEVVTEKVTSTLKVPEVTVTTTEKIDPDAFSTENATTDSRSTLTSEVNFVHVETVGVNQTTFIPETLSPNFNYPIAYNDTKERAVPNVSPYSTVETTTTEDIDDTTGTSSATENIVVDNNGENKGKIAAIVISSVGAVCLVILAGLLYIMKKRQRKFNYKQRCRPVSLDDYSVDNLSAYNSVRRKGADRQSKRSYGNPAFEDPTVPSHPINFPALAKFATNTEDMKAEFEEIPQISARTSELPEGCETKNRYANVIPLPETRVYLRTVEGCPNSDYINANYVTGPKNTRGYYIACQAPMQNTVDDFWRMVWEQQCRVILMITHLFENGVEKCADYLPPSEVLDCHRLFGDFQVTLKRREAKEKYIISSIQLKNMVSNSWRDITHFWYLGWPGKGIPHEANSLIAFLIEARSYMKATTLDKNVSPSQIRNETSHNEINPVIVHCSPGTGRTGVVIACDIAIREFEKNRLVDIPKIVYRIRRDRANAVQTKEQYMFIYKVISLYATKLTGGALDTF